MTSETDSEARVTDSAEESVEKALHLLQRHKLVESLVHKQDMPHKHELIESLVHKQHLSELQRLLDTLHPAVVAHVLEALPIDDRLLVWSLVKAERDGEILLEVSDAVRETLIADMDRHELLAAASTLDTDEIADIAEDLPRDVVQALLSSLDAQKRERLKSALSYPEDTVGALMDFDFVSVREDVSLEVTQRYLRRLGELPDQTDKLFVVDRGGVLRGVLPLKRLLLRDPNEEVASAMVGDAVTFEPDDEADDAAEAFERYDLVTAPVVDADGRLVGRLTVDTVVDYIREEGEAEVLSLAGLKEEEDLFAPVWKSLQNRWPWLGINLVTAFVASRVIGMFEGSIEKLVALAALMPIVAGIGGNSGNQTTTMIIRGLALGHVGAANARRLLVKEVGVSAISGVVWGAVVGLFAVFIYQSISLGLVMMSAMLLNLVLAALAGVFIPLTMHRLGRDPASGSSVLITAITDSGGFFIFLGLATLFLI